MSSAASLPISAPIPGLSPRTPGDARALPAYVQGLNDRQREAVEAVDGPVLVLAGAGTGKTRVLTTRLAHILATRRAFPSQLLAVTFTNKAAREMRDRLERQIGDMANGLWLGTFHSLAARVLRRHAELVGLKPNFTILDTDDQLRVLKQLLTAERIDDRRWPARAVLGCIERWKDRGLTPDKVPVDDAGDFAGGKALMLYRQYQERLATLNAADFGDLLLHNLTIFLTRPEVLEEYQRRWRYLLVDEYQDTNVAQYLWLRLLAQSHRNICCVGDDDQSIYSWRGAEIANILKFERDFPGAAVIRLEQNYRSTPEILATAAGLIARNKGRLGKTLWTESGAGDQVTLKGLWDGPEEARWIGDEIEALQRQGHPLAQMAILVRATFQTREFEERFITLGLPYRVIGGPRFYERQEVRDAMAYLRLLNQPDDDLAFERIVNVPRRGIGTATLQSLHGLARARQLPLTQAARELVQSDELKPAARKALGTLLRDLDRWTHQAGHKSHTDLAQIVLDESGYTAMWMADKSVEAPGRLENLKELVVAMAEFETLGGFLEHVSLVMDNATENAGDMVSMMTLHGAKGLEFDTVFLPGWEEGLFPHQRAVDQGGSAGLEEERRLAYVGITRARRRAFISHAANRRVHGTWQSALPSRFVEELPREHLCVVSEPGLAPGSGSYFEAAPTGGVGRWNEGWKRESGFGAKGFASGGAGTAAGRSGGILIEGHVSGGGGPREGVEVRKVGGFHPGERVFHQKFGYGSVIAVEENKLTIRFEKAGEKRVMDAFVAKA